MNRLKKLNIFNISSNSISRCLNSRINGPRYNVKKDCLCELKYFTIHIINNILILYCVYDTFFNFNQVLTNSL